MRVIAGRLGGRNFDSPKGHRTHPMSEKVRGAIFSALGEVDGLTVLDVYSGSGALSYEAISRGATSSTAIDLDKNAHSIIQENSKKLGITAQLKNTKAGFRGWSGRNVNHKYDLVFADPPYDQISLKEINLLSRHMYPDGTMVLSWPGSSDAPNLKGLQIVKQKDYGDAQLVFYKKIG